GIGPADQRMGMGRTNHDRIGLTGQVHVVAVPPGAAQQAQILAPPDRLADAGAAGSAVHYTSLTSCHCERSEAISRQIGLIRWGLLRRSAPRNDSLFYAGKDRKHLSEARM